MDDATSIAAAQGPEMGRAILQLYRSARQPAMAEAGRALEVAAARPGLSILATEAGSGVQSGSFNVKQLLTAPLVVVCFPAAAKAK